MIRREAAEALRGFYEDRAALYDSMAARQTSRSLAAGARGLRDYDLRQARKYDRLARHAWRRWFARPPR